MFGPFFKAAACAALICGAVPAMAATVVVNTTGNMADNGAYGNALTFSGTGGGTTVNVRATGWQVNQSNNAVTSAYIGAYSPGTGVTGINDASGSPFHQADNVSGYNDFVLLQFDRAVNLSSIYLNSFQMSNVSGIDNDLGFAAVNYGGALWNSALNLAGGTFVPGSLTTVNGTGANGARATGSGVYSNQWLVSSAFASGNNDGLKIASLTVNTGAVPEPATWAMMLIGFGAAGVSLRRKRPALAMQAA